jgi:hypothetical protein
VSEESNRELEDIAFEVTSKASSLAGQTNSIWSGMDPVESKPMKAKPTKKAVRNQLAVFLKEAREIQNGLHYSKKDEGSEG